MMRVVWIASGLSTQTTGIERFCLSLARELLESGRLSNRELLVHADHGAEWADDLRSLGVRCQVGGPGRLTRLPAVPVGTRLVHNFGGALFPSGKGAQVTRVFSIYDWGPFRDQAMPLRGRVAWAQAILRGVREASIVHYLNPRLSQTRPWLVSAPACSTTAYCSSSLATLPDSWELPLPGEPKYAIFVGTDVPRKRIQHIVLMANQTRTRVVLVGQGTEAYLCSPYVVALGRVDDSRLSALLDGSSALLLVSKYEGFGIPVLEAAARGILSVVSEEVAATLPAAMREHVAVVDPLDPTAFALAVRYAFDHRGLTRFEGGSFLAPLLKVYADATN